MINEIYFKLSFAMPHERMNCDLTFLNSCQMVFIPWVVVAVFSMTPRNNFVSSASSSPKIDRTDASLFFQKVNSE